MLWNTVDRMWLALASVRLTLVLLVGLLLLSIPGTLFLQYNISNVDPGLQYSYDFWRFGQVIDLFQAYQSWWYVALLVLLSMNLISCSVERWPQMWKLANAKPVAWAKATFANQPPELRYTWRTSLGKEDLQAKLLAALRKKGWRPVVVEESPTSFQFYWQVGRWARVANYLVHTCLLMVFAGGIITAIYGFEGAANIPDGQAVDTFLSFKEGKGSGLVPAPGGLPNERLLGFRVACDRFDVSFYPDYPGRPSAFISQLRVIDQGKDMQSREIRVNDPLVYKNFTFYQASYGRMGDFRVKAHIVNRAQPTAATQSVTLTLGEKSVAAGFGVELVLLQAMNDVLGMGPGARWQELRAGKAVGEPFWSLAQYPQYDFRARKEAKYAVVLDDVRELYFTGLQIAHDPGAPLYWLGCAGMLLGTFYALFITHRRFHLRFENGELDFAGQIHRLPIGFREKLARLAQQLREVSGAKAT